MDQPLLPTAAPAADTVDSLRRRLRLERIVFVAVIVGLCGAWALSAQRPGAWGVFVDGKPVVAMASRQELQSLVDAELHARQAEAPGAKFAGSVQVQPVDPARNPPATAAAARKKLETALTFVAPRAVIYVDDVPVVALATEAEAQAVLDQMRAGADAGIQELEEAPAFQQKVEVRTEPAKDEAWADTETALGLLRGEAGEGEGVYKVVRNDTSWGIARKHQLSRERLVELNPGVNLARLKIGQALNVTGAAEPVLTVAATGKVTKVESLPYPIQIRRSPNMYVGKREIIQAGRPGRQRVTYQVRTQSGREVERKTLSRTVLKPPRTQVVVLGSRPRP